MRSFKEKPADPASLPGVPDRAFASMGIYVFSTGAMVEAVTRDSENAGSKHDLGGSIVPMFVARGEAAVYDFAANEVPGETAPEHAYWRDVGDLDSYYEASMDLIAVDPVFNLYNREWPIYSYLPPLPPAKFVLDEEGRRGQALDSLVSSGVIVSGGTVRRSVLSPGVVVRESALVEDCVLMDGVNVGPGAVVRRAILDKNVRIAEGTTIGYDLEEDKRRHHVTESGIVVVEGLRSSVDISAISV